MATLSAQPKRQDVERFKEFVHDFGLNTDFYRWLKIDFAVKSATGGQIAQSAYLQTKWDHDPSNFSDDEMADSLTRFKSALGKLNDEMGINYAPRVDMLDINTPFEDQRYSIPHDYGHEERRAAVDSIDRAGRDVLDAHEALYRLGMSKGMGVGASHQPWL
jgi:hypothetical protein